MFFVCDYGFSNCSLVGLSTVRELTKHKSRSDLSVWQRHLSELSEERPRSSRRWFFFSFSTAFCSVIPSSLLQYDSVIMNVNTWSNDVEANSKVSFHKKTCFLGKNWRSSGNWSMRQIYCRLIPEFCFSTDSHLSQVALHMSSPSLSLRKGAKEK